mmetsp:Transcript_27878/g.86412  ORF Transcript_27878/g.86412 Transcript_27878/m.86412 type:complete len:256 (+) Transcript_27878:1410-2177(+)
MEALTDRHVRDRPQLGPPVRIRTRVQGRVARSSVLPQQQPRQRRVEDAPEQRPRRVPLGDVPHGVVAARAHDRRDDRARHDDRRRRGEARREVGKGRPPRPDEVNHCREHRRGRHVAAAHAARRSRPASRGGSIKARGAARAPPPHVGSLPRRHGARGAAHGAPEDAQGRARVAARDDAGRGEHAGGRARTRERNRQRGQRAPEFPRPWPRPWELLCHNAIAAHVAAEPGRPRSRAVDGRHDALRRVYQRRLHGA